MQKRNLRMEAVRWWIGFGRDLWLQWRRGRRLAGLQYHWMDR